MGYYAFDFDGTLSTHLRGGGVNGVGEPIPEMVGRVRALLAKGEEVRIITARFLHAHPDEGYRAHWNAMQVAMIHKFLAEQQLPPLQVQSHKCFSMLMLYDDRCVQVETNTGQVLGREPDGYGEFYGTPFVSNRRSANS